MGTKSWHLAIGGVSARGVRSLATNLNQTAVRGKRMEVTAFVGELV